MGGDWKKSSENYQLAGHFQSFFLLISPEQTVKLVIKSKPTIICIKTFKNFKICLKFCI